MLLIGQGAEAKVFRTEFLGEQAVMKQRIAKAYRHPDLDRELLSRRIKDVLFSYVVLIFVGSQVYFKVFEEWHQCTGDL